jgi:RHS repeat-associated protein
MFRCFEPDDPLVWYSGSGLTNKRWLHADHLGSIVAWTTATGGSPTLNKYDEYGVPAATNTGRFQYTGQAWIGEVGLYYYKARFYSPALGRFLQTDPVGYEGGVNLYAYVEGDPVNNGDPTGTERYKVNVDFSFAIGKGYNLNVSAEFDTQSLEIGGGVELGGTAGFGVDFGISGSKENSSELGNFANAGIAVKAEADVGVRLTRNISIGAQGKVERSFEASTNRGLQTTRSVEASANIGQHYVSTSGTAPPPGNVMSAKVDVSVTGKAKGNASLKPAVNFVKSIVRNILDHF